MDWPSIPLHIRRSCAGHAELPQRAGNMCEKLTGERCGSPRSLRAAVSLILGAGLAWNPRGGASGRGAGSLGCDELAIVADVRRGEPMPRIAWRFVWVLALGLVPAGSASAGLHAQSFQIAFGARAHGGAGDRGEGAIGGGAGPWSGYFGPAFKLDGIVRRAVVPDDPSLEPASQVSVSVYVRARGLPGTYQYLVAKGAAGCVGASYGLYTGPTGGLVFYVSQNDGLSFVRSPDAGGGIWDGRWHLAVGTYDGDEVRLYVDGSELGAGEPLTGPIGYGLTGSNELFFSRDGRCAGTRFSGLIAQPTIWSRALSRLEVDAAYLARVAASRSGDRQIGFAP
jgi:Concanavalin A-like lectin/glucanases superfamily